MNIEQIWQILVGILIVAAPLIITAIGGMFSEKSGVVNIGLEGIMTFSAFLTSIGIYILEMQGLHGFYVLGIGIIIGIVGGLLFALIHGVLTIYFNVDQIISGTAINIIGLGLALFLTEVIFNSAQTPYKQSFNLMILRIPLIIIIIFLLVLFSYFIINKTKWGLRVKACGENPQAARSVGIDVKKVRMQAVLLSGVFGAIGGGALVVLVSGNFSAATVSGRGFIALAVLIFGGWRPLGIMGAGLLFGFLTQLGVIINTIALPKINLPILFMIFIIVLLIFIVVINKSKIINILIMLLIYILTLSLIYNKILPMIFSTKSVVPATYYDILPYIMTIVALIYYSKEKLEPKALGEPYDAQAR